MLFRSKRLLFAVAAAHSANDTALQHPAECRVTLSGWRDNGTWPPLPSLNLTALCDHQRWADAPLDCAASTTASTTPSRAPLGPTVTSALTSLAAAVTPTITIMLGSTIGERRSAATATAAAAASGSGATRIRMAVLVGVCIARLLVMPLVGIAAVAAGVRLGLVPRATPDAITLQFVLLLEASTPPALNLQLLAEVAGKGQRQMAQVIAVTYCASVVTLTAWISLFLVLTRSGSLG